MPSFNQSLGSISEFHVKIPDIFHSCDIVKDVYGLENYFIAKHHDRVPVICDPYESFSSFVSALETNIEPRVVRTEDPKWKDAISDAMRKGYTVLLLATDMLEPDLYLIDFMREYNWYICNKLKLFQDFNGENIEVNKQFKLYVFINQSLNYASFKWTKHTAAVSCSVEVETVSTILLDILLTTCSVKNREQLIHFEIDSINRSNRLLALENRGLEFVLSLNDSDLIGGESFRLITEVEDQIIVTSTYMTSSQRQERDLLTQIVWHTKFSAFCAKVFKTVEKMAKVSAMYAISLSSFISIFKTSIGDITSPTRPTPLESLPLLLLKNVYDSFVYGFERTDAVLFVFMLAIEYNIYIEKKDQLLQITPSLWHYFINGKIHKDVKFPKKWHVDEFPANPSPQYLKRTSWEKILTLSKHPEFFKFAMEFVRYANKATTPPTEANWEDVFKCLDPCSAKFPTRWDSELTKFQRLLVIQCLRPDSIISCIQDYVAESIGDGFLEAPLDSLGVAIKRSLPMTPILLTYSINDDPVKQIKWFASRQNMGNFINIVSFGLVSDKQMDEILEDASKRGKWVVFQNCHLFANKVRLIEQKYRSFQQESRQLQPNFRVWLVSRPYTFFSMYVYTQSTRVHIDSPVTLGQLVEAIFPVLEENIVPHEFRSTISYRSYLLKITILFMSLNARRQYAISSCISDHAFGMSDLQLSVSLLREGFNSYGTSADKQIPKRTLALFGELPFVSKSMDTWDRRLLTTLFNEVMNIDWADGDSFSSADLPFKQILEHMNKNELQQALGLIYDFANFNNPQIFGLNENAIVVGRRVESKTFMKSLMIYDSKSLTMLPLSIWSDQTTIINMIKVHFDRLNDLIQNSAMDFNFKTTSGGGLSELFDSHSKQRHIERVLLDNILRYRSMAKMISFNLTAVIEAHHGRITFTSRIKSMVEDIHCNIIPKEWLISENWYICRFGYKEWFENFLLRLAFIKEWFQTRLESMPEFTGMPMYDISLLYFPQAFLNGKQYV